MQHARRLLESRPFLSRVPDDTVIVEDRVPTSVPGRPRDGMASAIGEFPNEGTRTFVPPDRGEALDWVLVLDDAAQHYPPPGGTKQN